MFNKNEDDIFAKEFMHYIKTYMVVEKGYRWQSTNSGYSIDWKDGLGLKFELADTDYYKIVATVANNATEIIVTIEKNQLFYKEDTTKKTIPTFFLSCDDEDRAKLNKLKDEEKKQAVINMLEENKEHIKKVLDLCHTKVSNYNHHMSKLIMNEDKKFNIEFQFDAENLQ